MGYKHLFALKRPPFIVFVPMAEADIRDGRECGPCPIGEERPAVLGSRLHWLPQGALATSADIPALFNPAFPTDGPAVTFGWISHLRPSGCGGSSLDHATKDTVRVETFYLSSPRLR